MLFTPVFNFNKPQDVDPVDELAFDANWDTQDAAPGISALTQAQINALTAQQKPDGRPIWNITTRVVQFWDNVNGVWVTASGSYRTLLTGLGQYSLAAISATALPLEQTGQPQAAGFTRDNNAIAIRAADFVTGEQLNIRAWIIVGANAPGQAITFELRPLTVAAGALAIGAAVAGGGITIPAPGANTITDGTSGDFALPVDGLYVLTVRAAAASAAQNFAVGAILRAKQ